MRQQVLLKKGYQAELEGLGVGAFASYRRIFEELTKNLITQVKEVAINSRQMDVAAALDTALATRSFEQNS